MTTPASGWLVRQLPVAMLQDDFLARFTSIFEEVADTLVHSVDTIGIAADLSITPDPFVHWLGGWIGAPADPEEGRHDVRERDWVRAQARALSARGTRAGLEELLRELAGGHPVEVTDGGGVYREGRCPGGDTGWVRVRMPLPGRADPQDVLDLIRAEVPIGVDVDLVVRPVAGPDGVLIPAPRASEPELAARDEQWNAVPGGPYSWDGGPEDSQPEFLETIIIEPLSPDPDPVTELSAAELSAAARRLPGIGGRAGRTGRICPACAEHNEAGVSACQRCGSPMRIVPSAPIPEPEPVRAIAEPELWLPERRVWLMVTLAVVAVLLFGALIAIPFLLL
jgi:phage tail-like protein